MCFHQYSLPLRQADVPGQLPFLHGTFPQCQLCVKTKLTRMDNTGVSYYDGGKLVIPERKAVHCIGLIGASSIVRVEAHPECSQLTEDLFVCILGYEQIQSLFFPPNSTYMFPGLNLSTNPLTVPTRHCGSSVIVGTASEGEDIQHYKDTHFLQGKSSRKLQAYVSQRVKCHCMTQLRVSFPKDLVPVAKH